MLSLRRIALVSVALVAAAISSAQVDGPVPLSWRWSGSTTQSPNGVPAFMGDNVYVGVGGRVYCLDRTLGNKKWQFPALEGVNGNFVSSPVIADGVIYAAATNRTLYAIDANTGEQKWSYYAPGAIIGDPVVSGQYIVLNVDGQSLQAIGTDGQPAFQNPERVFDGIMGGLVANGTNVIYTTGRYEIYSMNIATRKSSRIAALQALASHYAPVIMNGNLFVTSGSYMIALNPIGGGFKFKRDLQEGAAFAPTASADTLAMVSESGRMFLFDANGAPKTRSVKDDRGVSRNVPMIVDLGSRPVAGPSVVGKMFVIPTVNGALNMIDPSKGEVVWSFVIRPVTAGLRAAADAGSTKGGDLILSIPAAGPAVLNGQSMYILAADGSLLAFDKQTGVDLTGPDVTMLWPQQGLQVGNTKGPLEVYFQVADEATGVNEKSLNVTVNGNPVNYDYGRDGIISLRFGNSEKNKPLNDGRASFEITATDWMGNKTVKTYSLGIDNNLTPVARPGGKPGDQSGTPGRGPAGRQGGGGGAGGVGGG